MKIVQGEYENGVVKPLEEVPEIANKRVLITFFEEDSLEEKLFGDITLQQSEQFLKEYLSDEREDLYQEYLNKDNEDR
jgi:predicted DNA-binding antitoxin AbrB/MazE fold protein